MGDKVTQCIKNATIAFAVISVKQIGSHFMLTFSSTFGVESVYYRGEDFITATWKKHASEWLLSDLSFPNKKSPIWGFFYYGSNA